MGRRAKAPRPLPKKIADLQMVPETVRPSTQLAPLYGGNANLQAAIQQAQQLSNQIYPGLSSADPDMVAAFPPVDYSRYGQEIPVEVAGGMANQPEGFFNPSYGDPDTPMPDSLVLNEDLTFPYATEYPGGNLLNPNVLSRMVAADPGDIARGVEMPMTDFLTMPTGEDANLAARRAQLAPNSMFSEFTTPEQIDQTLAQIRRRQGGDMDAATEDLQGFYLPDPETLGDSGLDVQRLIALRNLPERVRNFLPQRMGMIPSLMGAAVGLGAGMAAGNNRQQPSLRTDYTMGPLSGLTR